MSVHVKAFTATIMTDSGVDRAITCIDPALLAKDVLELAPHIKDAIDLTGDDEVFEAISRDLIYGWGAEVDEHGNIHPNAFGKCFPDRFHEALIEAVAASQAAQDWAKEEYEYGYSLEQHYADETAILQVL